MRRKGKVEKVVASNTRVWVGGESFGTLTVVRLEIQMLGFRLLRSRLYDPQHAVGKSSSSSQVGDEFKG